MSSRNLPWSPDRTEQLKRLWADGFSASKIACEMGLLSRSAVIGKVHRLKLAPRRTSNILKQSKPARPTNYELALTRRLRLSKKNGATPVIVEESFVEPIIDFEIPIEQRKTILELTSYTCRFPVGDPSARDFFFCGGPTKDQSQYCAFHHQLSYERPRPHSPSRPYRSQPRY